MLLKSNYCGFHHEYLRVLRGIYYSLAKAYQRSFFVVKYGNPDMFNDIIIETTTQCNRRCGYCPNSVYDRSLKHNSHLMSEHLFMKIINDLKEMRFAGRISPHFYGEPLLDKRLYRLMKYAHDTLPKAH